ncbi:MAG TPA: tRNA (guanosine(37)-N1)-methyltransferase TrmD [Armatimonadetes bacterium]|nr:tRNA (guanosine(37)-N1)-methyltransferase TrmD [Armatimonadota bacterium]
MRFDIFTIFPEWFESPLHCSLLGRAIERGIIEVHCHNIRDYALDKHRVVDDYPYGGGAGMVMKPEPIFNAVESVLRQLPKKHGKPPIILLSPQGRVLCHEVVLELARHQCLFLICGHYEGVDERVREHLATDEISVGDYVLSGGEPAAMIIIDAVSRFVPGVLGNEASLQNESFAQGLLEHPQYTRPRDFRGWVVPEVLISGNHQAIARWRRKESLRRTLLRRPELLQRAQLNGEDLKLLEEVKRELRCENSITEG